MVGDEVASLRKADPRPARNDTGRWGYSNIGIIFCLGADNSLSVLIVITPIDALRIGADTGTSSGLSVTAVVNAQCH